MSTSLNALIAKIAALPVQYDTVIVPVVYEQTQPDWLDHAQLPVRVIPAIDGVTLQRATIYTHSRAPRAEWRITDLLLVRDVGMGRGVRDSAAALIAYIEDYVAALQLLWPQRGDVNVINASGQITIINYGERRYEGVVMTLDIAHILRSPTT